MSAIPTYSMHLNTSSQAKLEEFIRETTKLIQTNLLPQLLAYALEDVFKLESNDAMGIVEKVIAYTRCIECNIKLGERKGPVKRPNASVTQDNQLWESHSNIPLVQSDTTNFGVAGPSHLYNPSQATADTPQQMGGGIGNHATPMNESYGREMNSKRKALHDEDSAVWHSSKRLRINSNSNTSTANSNVQERQPILPTTTDPLNINPYSSDVATQSMAVDNTMLTGQHGNDSTNTDFSNLAYYNPIPVEPLYPSLSPRPYDSGFEDPTLDLSNYFKFPSTPPPPLVPPPTADSDLATTPVQQPPSSNNPPLLPPTTTQATSDPGSSSGLDHPPVPPHPNATKPSGSNKKNYPRSRKAWSVNPPRKNGKKKSLPEPGKSRFEETWVLSGTPNSEPEAVILDGKPIP